MQISPVHITRNTGEPEILIASPVYLNNVFWDVAVIDAYWSLVLEILSKIVIGKTGYAYLIRVDPEKLIPFGDDDFKNF